MTAIKKSISTNADFLVRGKNACNTLLYQLIGLVAVMITQFINMLYKGILPEYRFLETFALVIGIYLVIIVVRYFIWGINNNNSLGRKTRDEIIECLKKELKINADDH